MVYAGYDGTNITVATPSHLVARALDSFLGSYTPDLADVPDLQSLVPDDIKQHTAFNWETIRTPPSAKTLGLDGGGEDLVDTLLKEAEEINGRISAILAGEYGDDRRTTVTLAYLNLSLDHHTAIILLMRNKLFGSGLALARSIFEAMLPAHWVVGCATDEEIDKLAEDPSFDIGSRVDPDRIDEAFRSDGFFRQVKTSAWQAMNAYTHSGLLQLSRQFAGSKINANYGEEELVAGLSSATASVLMLGYLLAKSTGRSAEATEIEKLFDFGRTIIRQEGD